MRKGQTLVHGAVTDGRMWEIELGHNLTQPSNLRARKAFLNTETTDPRGKFCKSNYLIKECEKNEKRYKCNQPRTTIQNT